MMLKITLFYCLILFIIQSLFGEILRRNKTELIKKLLMKRRRNEGAIRLVGGRVANEGILELLFKKIQSNFNFLSLEEKLE